MLQGTSSASADRLASPGLCARAVYPSLPPAWRHSYEASVSLGMEGRHYPAWRLTGRRAVEPFRLGTIALRAAW